MPSDFRNIMAQRFRDANRSGVNEPDGDEQSEPSEATRPFGSWSLPNHCWVCGGSTWSENDARCAACDSIRVPPEGFQSIVGWDVGLPDSPFARIPIGLHTITGIQCNTPYDARLIYCTHYLQVPRETLEEALADGSGLGVFRHMNLLFSQIRVSVLIRIVHESSRFNSRIESHAVS